MNARTRMKIEIDTLHELIGDIDYYRILVIDRDCEPAAIADAFRTESRRLHPDRISALRDDEMSEKANDIYRLIGEAHRCLKDPEQRSQYDQLLEQGVIRMTDEAKEGAAADKRAGDPEQAATNPKSEKYWKMALADWENESYNACVMNINFALTFEPGNDTFKEWLEKAKKAHTEADAKKEKNPYKLRLM